jgi:hypothetical protein
MAGVQFVYLPDILVTYSADPQAARTSRRVNAAPSLAWLEIASAYLSQAQRDAFYFRHVFDMEWQQSPLSATQRGLAATLRGNVAWPRFLRALAAEVIPSPLRRRLRSFIKSGGS